ncbi:alanine--tRNA ligase-related protein [Streptomyces sp. V4-01]|uniref:alanine--tRNA ligase n=1 Tax=Actinacidiphila polyblastidii TaxID=3110430 RepID=A0ABU7PAT3_9ACTN|nr:alanine--tRNA ligase-related protein [Streptomyces sp. V4-01]
MNTEQTRTAFTDFFRERGHRITPGAPLPRPPGDPVLFTTSGMHPLTPYLEGRPHPLGDRLTGVQRCLRTTDLEEVGDATHLTVFEMLGSWSLGDYGMDRTLRLGHELLTGVYGVHPGLLHATVFGGDDQLGPDTESLDTWRDLGVPVELTREDNWWSNGPTGPCGPDSEIFVWTGVGPPRNTPQSDDRWVEVWNHVHMRYRRLDDNTLRPLPRHSIDTGMGLERLAMVLRGDCSVFESDLFEPWTRALPALWDLDGARLRIAADHLRSAVVVAGDGVTPSGTGRGYVLRRLLRRVLTLLRQDDRAGEGTDGRPRRTLADLPGGPIEHTLVHFGLPCPPRRADEVRDLLVDEERRFTGMLDRGRRVLSRRRFAGPLGEEEYHYLHDTHGLPRELVDLLRGVG